MSVVGVYSSRQALVWSTEHAVFALTIAGPHGYGKMSGSPHCDRTVLHGTRGPVRWLVVLPSFRQGSRCRVNWDLEVTYAKRGLICTA